jgi:hypothetical protein
MADNIEEEHLDNPTNNQSENPPDEISPINDTETINPNQESENMEVHKHPHHVTHKKKWGEYLLEFIMLFLAVFLGFVAENIREHEVEKSRTKELATTLIADLKKDSGQIRVLSEYRTMRLQYIDSFLQMINKPLSQIDRLSFYRAARRIQDTKTFIPATGTIQELKSAGYLRYFINTNLASLLAEYDAIYSACEADEKVEYDVIYNRYYTALLHSTEAKSVDSLFNYTQDIKGTGISVIKSEDLNELVKIVTLVKHCNSIFIREKGTYDNLKNKEIEIISYLRKEFEVGND